MRAWFGSTASAWSDTVSFNTVTPGFNISAPILPEFNLQGTKSITIADLTGTGKKEIIFLGQRRSSGTSNLYRARKENSSWIVVDSFYHSVGYTYSGVTPFPIDLDNDGDVDLVYNSNVLWNQNGQFANQGSVSITSGGSAVDQGNDGLFDLFLDVGFYVNWGNGQFNPGTSYIKGIPVADFNKDNRIDWIDASGLIGYSDPVKDTVALNYWPGDFNLDPNSSYRAGPPEILMGMDGPTWLHSSP